MAEGTPVEQIERALEALEKYSEHWVLEHMHDYVESPEHLMFYKDRFGNSPWLEQIQTRSQLLLARAIERQNELAQPKYKIKYNPDRVPQPSRRIFERALEQAGPNDSVRDVVNLFKAKYGPQETVAFIQWLKPQLPKEAADELQA